MDAGFLEARVGPGIVIPGLDGAGAGIGEEDAEDHAGGERECATPTGLNGGWGGTPGAALVCLRHTSLCPRLPMCNPFGVGDGLDLIHWEHPDEILDFAPAQEPKP